MFKTNVNSVFDPRRKMQFVSLCFDSIYGKDTAENIQAKESVLTVLRNLYEEYSMLMKASDDAANTTSASEIPASSFQSYMSDDEDGYESMDFLYTQMVNEKGTEEGSSELEMYLMEKVELQATNNLGMNYNVLSWWKKNTPKYPVLAELARDVLAIQVSTVASESAFSTSGRILDPYRSSLTPYMIEALICTQQWLRASMETETSLSTMTQMLEELDFHESLDSRRQPGH
ncbi:putative AC transposase [Cardamine amara subsp. amara]|uniref:AC transposase n=1 Tax=Cardamine amara subsp. amara TaxID=228776 RepID=A0ABD1C7M6_CARAN